MEVSTSTAPSTRPTTIDTLCNRGVDTNIRQQQQPPTPCNAVTQLNKTVWGNTCNIDHEAVTDGFRDSTTSQYSPLEGMDPTSLAFSYPADKLGHFDVEEIPDEIPADTKDLRPIQLDPAVDTLAGVGAWSDEFVDNQVWSPLVDFPDWEEREYLPMERFMKSGRVHGASVYDMVHAKSLDCCGAFGLSE